MIRKLKNEIDLELKRFLADIGKKNAFSGSSRLLIDGIEDFVLRDGKRIRPILFLLTYLGYSKSKNIDRKKLLRSAVSFEILHDSFLMHDDVIDNSDLRRGKPTLHKYYGRRMPRNTEMRIPEGLSIVAGDTLFALCVGSLMAIDEKPLRKEAALKSFIDSVFNTCVGEFIDVAEGVKDIKDLKEKDVYRIYDLKTARYTFQGPMITGAILAGVPSPEIKKLSQAGLLLGRVFQIVDDLRDFFLASEHTGKSRFSDLKEAKKTLLAVSAYNMLKPSDRKKFNSLFMKNKRTDKDVAVLSGIILSSGAVLSCFRGAKISIKRSNNIILGLKLREKYKKEIRSISDNLLQKINDLDAHIGSC